MKFASIAAVSFLCATAACGSSVETDPSDDAATTSTGATTSSVAATTSVASSGAGTTSTAVGTSSSSANGGGGEGGDISTGEGGAGGVTVGAGGEGGTGGAGSGAGGPGSGGAGGGVVEEPFLCGEVECAPDEQCCGSQQGVTCLDAQEACQGAVLTCQSAANCTGDDICCLQGDLQNAESVCTDVCEPTQAGPLQLCETADECVDDVPCMEIFGGFKVCSSGFPF